MTEYSVILEERPEELIIGCQIVTDLVEVDNDNITFGSKFGNTRNPLKFKGDIWPVSVTFHSVTTVHYMILLTTSMKRSVYNIILMPKNSVCIAMCIYILHLNIIKVYICIYCCLL